MKRTRVETLDDIKTKKLRQQPLHLLPPHITLYILGYHEISLSNCLKAHEEEQQNIKLNKRAVSKHLINKLFGYFRNDRTRRPLLLFPSITMTPITPPVDAVTILSDGSPSIASIEESSTVDNISKQCATLLLNMISTTSKLFPYLNLSGLYAHTLCPSLIGGDSMVGVELLDMSESGITDFDVPLFSKVRSLKKLVLRANEVTDAGVSGLLGMPNIRSLDVSHNNITDHGLSTAKDAKFLTSINLSFNMINDEGLQFLSQCKPLRKISLRYMCLRGESLNSLFVGALNQLQSIDLSYNSIDDEGAQVLAEYGKYLIEIDLGYNEIGDKGVAALFKCDKLERLYVNNNNIYSDGLKAVVYNKKITKLNLKNNKVCAKGAVILSLNGCIRWLDVSNNLITECSANLLLKSRKFDHLDLSENLYNKND